MPFKILPRGQLAALRTGGVEPVTAQHAVVAEGEGSSPTRHDQWTATSVRVGPIDHGLE